MEIWQEKWKKQKNLYDDTLLSKKWGLMLQLLSEVYSRVVSNIEHEDFDIVSLLDEYDP